MACCLLAPGQCLSQCYIIINRVYLHLLDNKLTYIATQIIPQIYLKIADYETNATFPQQPVS